jgi:acyl carrier protein
MPELDSLEQKVIELIAQKKHLPPESVTLDSSFVELGIDSLDGMDLLFTFEETFKLSVPDEVAQQMKSVRQVTEALRAALAANSQPSSN